MTEELPSCVHCGREVKDKGRPSMEAGWKAFWVHVPGGYTLCRPQQRDSPRATPKGGALK